MIPDKYKFLIIAAVWVSSIFAAVAAGHAISELKWEKTYSEHLAQDSRVNELAATTALDKQREYSKKLGEVQEYAKSLETTVADDKSVNDAANDGVQQQFNRIEALPEISTDATIVERAAAATDRLVLAQLLSWTHEAYRRTAEQADENRKAGLICEAEYDALVKVCG